MSAACTTGEVHSRRNQFNLNRCYSTVRLPGVWGVFLCPLCSLLRFPSPCFSFTSANNVGVISFQGACLSSHQAREQRGGDGSSDSGRRRYRAEPISGPHSCSSSFTDPPPKTMLFMRLTEGEGGRRDGSCCLFSH